MVVKLGNAAALIIAVINLSAGHYIIFDLIHYMRT